MSDWHYNMVVVHIFLPSLKEQLVSNGIRDGSLIGYRLEVIQLREGRVDVAVAGGIRPQTEVRIIVIHWHRFIEAANFIIKKAHADGHACACDGDVVANDMRKAIITDRVRRRSMINMRRVAVDAQHHPAMLDSLSGNRSRGADNAGCRSLHQFDQGINPIGRYHLHVWSFNRTTISVLTCLSVKFTLLE